MNPEVTMVEAKSSRLVMLEGGLYFFIAALTPVIGLLESDRDLTSRSLTCAVLAGLIAGAVSLKAFLSQSRYQ